MDTEFGRERGMLTLTRKTGEALILRYGEIDIDIRVMDVSGKEVRLRIDAPLSVQVNREEIDRYKKR